MKKKMITVSTAFLILLSGCTAANEQTEAQASASAASYNTYSNMSLDAGFDTILYLSQTTTSQDEFNENFAIAVELFSHYNDLFDIYNDYEGINNIKTINDNAGIAPVEVDEDIIELLTEAKYFYELSDGEFDITTGSLLNVWHEYRTEGISLNEEGELGNLPTDEELEEAARYKGWEHVQIDDENNTVYIDDANISLDVGGIAKGFAAEKIGQALEEKGVTAAAVNAGGNNRTVGAKVDDSNWRVGIQNPDGTGSIVVVSKYGSMSFVTSGDYERYYVASDGNSYSHIIDPSTLYPATHFRSVSIITEDSGVADCLSTSLFTLTYEEGLALVNKYKEDNPGIDLDVIWIMDPDKAVDAEYGSVIGDYYIAWTEGVNDSITW